MQPSEEEYADEDVEGEAEEEYDGEFGEDFLPSDASTKATDEAVLDCPNHAIAKVKVDLEVAHPVVYSGTFQDYKKESQKFCRFQTLASFTRAVRQNVCESGTRDAVPCEKLRCSIIDCVLPSGGGVPCQLVALASPPSAQGNHAVYVTLSSTLFFSTAPKAPSGRGDVATAKMVVAAVTPNEGQVSSSCSPSRAGGTEASATAAAVALPGKSPHRFCFKVEDLRELGPDGFVQSKLHTDDSSGWRVDDTSAGAPRWFSGLGQQRNRGAALEPIPQGKIKLDAPAVVALPKIPGRRSLGSHEQGQEAMRMCLGAVRAPGSVF